MASAIRPLRSASSALRQSASPSGGGGGSAGTNAGMFVFHFKPWDERTRNASQIQKQLAGMASQVTGIRINVLMPSSLPGSIGGAPVQMVITSVDGYESIFRVMEEIKKAARQSGLFLYVDSDLDFNTPTTKLNIDHVNEHYCNLVTYFRLKDMVPPSSQASGS